jgi:hypothetical protein
MIKAAIYIKDIDYETLLNLMMPQIEKGLTNKKNPILEVFSKVISKNGKPTKFSTLMMGLIPKKDEMVTCLIPHFDKVLIEYLNNQLAQNRITARVTDLKTDRIMRRNEAMMRILLELDSIDYMTILDNLLPTMIDSLSREEDKAGHIGNLLFSRKELSVNMVKAAVDVIPLQQRDVITVAVLTEYRVELRAFLNDLILKNNIRTKIIRVKFESAPNIIIGKRTN